MTSTRRLGRGRGGGRGGRGGGGANAESTLDGLSIWKGPIGRISAIDLNTGEYLWVAFRNGDAPDAHAGNTCVITRCVQGVENVADESCGRRGHSAMTVTPTMLLMASGQTGDDTPYALRHRQADGRASSGTVGDSGQLTRYGMSTWMHEDKQYVIIQLRDGLAAMALPVEGGNAGDGH